MAIVSRTHAFEKVRYLLPISMPYRLVHPAGSSKQLTLP
jgi:hypothetical protein